MTTFGFREKILGMKLRDIEITDSIGKGAMGEVYRGVKYVMGRPRYYAVKFLSPSGHFDEQLKTELTERFLREIDLMHNIIHPNVVPIREYGEDEKTGLLFYCMDLIEPTLKRNEIFQLPIDEKVDILHQSGCGLGAIHNSGIVHRDVKLANMLVQKQKGKIHAFVADVGIARVMGGEGGLTATGQFLGTPHYMSPQMIKYSEAVYADDQFGHGVVGYEITAKRKPFDGDVTTALYKIVNENPEPLRKIDPLIPLELERIIMRELEKDREARYPSMEAVTDELKKVLHGLRGDRSSVSLSMPPSAEGKTLVGDAAPAAGIGAVGNFDINPDAHEMSGSIEASGIPAAGTGQAIVFDDEEEGFSGEFWRFAGGLLMAPLRFAGRHWKGVAAAAALAPAGYFGWNYSEPYRAQYFGKPLVLDFNDEADARKLPRPAGWVVDTKHGFYSGFSRMRYPHTFREAEIRFDENTVVDMGNYRIEAKDGTVTLYDGSKDVRTVRFSSRPGNSLRLIYENESFSVYINGNSATLGGTPPRSLELGGGARLDRFTILE